MRLTLAIVAKTLFDADVNDNADEIGKSMEVLMTNFPRVANPLVRLTLMLPLKANREIFDAKDRLDNVIYRLIHERRATGRDHGDLLSMLLAAQDEDDGTGMTDLQVRDESITLFLAGHETTANVLAWAFYLLSQNPEAEARLHEEVDAVLQGGEGAMALFPKLPYTRYVIAETMRLYPPAHTLARLLMKDMNLGGYAIEKGATICFCPYIMHRDPRYWPEPERFDPMRWTPEEEEKRPKFTYFPFGGGPRTCIGEQFAWLEGVLALARLAKDWRAALVPGHPIDTYPLITLRPRHGIAMTLHRR
jgi:cytochrome P450